MLERRSAVCKDSAVSGEQQGWVDALETDMLPVRNGSFPSFGSVVKQVRLGLCTDGMGPPPGLTASCNLWFHTQDIQAGVERTDLPMVGLSPGPFYIGHQIA